MTAGTTHSDFHVILQNFSNEQIKFPATFAVIYSRDIRTPRTAAAKDAGASSDLQNDRCLLKIQARVTWMELARVSIAQVAEKIHFPLAVRKECRIQFVSVETGHRPAVQSQSACGQDEVSGLQRTVAEGVLLNQRFISDEVGADVGMWKELGKMLVKFRVPGDDNGHGSCHGFVDIAGR